MIPRLARSGINGKKCPEARLIAGFRLVQSMSRRGNC